MTLLIKLAGSLIAVLALAGLAKWLGLGGDPRIKNEHDAIRIAGEGVPGFEGVAAAVDLGGYSALVKDATNRHVVVSRTGNHWVARMICPPVEGRLDQRLLTIDLREPALPTVTLNLGEIAQYWASGLRHIPVGPA